MEGVSALGSSDSSFLFSGDRSTDLIRSVVSFSIHYSSSSGQGALEKKVGDLLGYWLGPHLFPPSLFLHLFILLTYLLLKCSGFLSVFTMPSEFFFRPQTNCISPFVFFVFWFQIRMVVGPFFCSICPIRVETQKWPEHAFVCSLWWMDSRVS